MQIHNIYADLSFFLSHVLNSILNDKIKKFKYNLGNVSFALNYNPNYELPVALVNFISLEPYNTRMSTFHKIFTDNVYLVPVLYDRNKDLELSLQEDLYYLNFTVDINCESQLHAIELKHNLENFLPVGKLLNYLSFCSFYKIDEIYLNKYLFDTNNDDIDNLFLIHDKISDSLVYCFSTEYMPLIKLESIDLSIQDISAATFAINTNFKILTHLPSKLVFNKPLTKDYTSVHLLRHDNLRLPVNDDFEYYLLNEEKLISAAPNNKQYIDNINDFVFNIEKSNNYTEIGEFNSIFQNEHINGKLELNHYETGAISIRITSYDNKFKNLILKDITLLPNNKLKALVNYNNNLEEIYLLYSILKVNRTVTIKEELNKYKIKNYRIIKPNQVYSLIKNINKYKVEINYEESLILGYNDILLQTPLKLSNNGDCIINIDNININFNIDLKSGQVTVFDNNVDLIFLNLNLVFTVFEIRGNGYIESINFDLTSSTFGNSISSVSVINNNNISYNKNVKNVLVDKINLIENDINNNIITFSIFNNVNILNNFTFSFYFTKSNRLIDSNTNLINFKDYDNNNLIFTTSSKMFFENFNEINNIYPLILKINI